jgi:hypothetical protein
VCEFATGKGTNNIPKIHCLDEEPQMNFQGQLRQNKAPNLA